jgi:hypothetical protein
MTAVPEPLTLALFGSGLLGLAAVRRKGVVTAERKSATGAAA